MATKCAVNFYMVLPICNIADTIDGWTVHKMMFIYGLSTISYVLRHCLFIDIITIPTPVVFGTKANGAETYLGFLGIPVEKISGAFSGRY